MDISVIIVSYNTCELTLQTIESVISGTENLSYEIILVDNSSEDNTLAEVKRLYKEKVKIIENNNNLGFAKANNIGIEKSRGNYVLLLNSDTVVKSGAIEKSFNYIKDRQGIGALGCKILLRDGSLDKACKRGFPTPWNSFCYALKLDRIFPKSKRFGGYNLTYLPDDKVLDVDCIMGAYMLLPKETLLKVGLLDEDFFMYGEDIDWCYRIKEAGYKIVYYPHAEIIHYKKASSLKRRTKTIREFYESMFIFYDKHYKNKYNFLINTLVYIGIKVQLSLALIKNTLKG